MTEKTKQQQSNNNLEIPVNAQEKQQSIDIIVPMIKIFEGLETKAYLCPAGHSTIGYGHLIKPGDPTVITKQQAEQFLMQDISIAANGMDKLITVKLNLNQYAALISWTFNLGSNNLRHSTLLKNINKNDMHEAANEFDKWVYCTNPKTHKLEVSQILVNRRVKEKKLFITPVA